MFNGHPISLNIKKKRYSFLSFTMFYLWFHSPKWTNEPKWMDYYQNKYKPRTNLISSSIFWQVTIVFTFYRCMLRNIPGWHRLPFHRSKPGTELVNPTSCPANRAWPPLAQCMQGWQSAIMQSCNHVMSNNINSIQTVFNSINSCLKHRNSYMDWGDN